MYFIEFPQMHIYLKHVTSHMINNIRVLQGITQKTPTYAQNYHVSSGSLENQSEKTAGI